MSEAKTNPTAAWAINLYCDCPACGDFVDLLAAPGFWDGRRLTFGEHDTERTRNMDVTCPECSHDFRVDLEL